MTERTNKMLVSTALRPILGEDRTSVTMTLGEGENQLGQVVLETPEFEAFLQELAEIRAKMTEPVPRDIDVGARVQAIVNPNWRIKLPSTAVSPSVVLVVRHPGYGWIANLFPVAEAKKLALNLLRISREQSPDA